MTTSKKTTAKNDEKPITLLPLPPNEEIWELTTLTTTTKKNAKQAPLAPQVKVQGINGHLNNYPNFPTILYTMLSDLDSIDDHNAISWAPHGRAIVFHNRELFVSKYLPLWFRFSTFSSFQRQLNIYGFTRICNGPEKHGYYHKLFLRSQPELIGEMKRNTKKGNKRQPGGPPPNFFDLESMPPMPTRPVRQVVTELLESGKLEKASTPPPSLVYGKEEYDEAMEEWNRTTAKAKKKEAAENLKENLKMNLDDTIIEYSSSSLSSGDDDDDEEDHMDKKTTTTSTDTDMDTDTSSSKKKKDVVESTSTQQPTSTSCKDNTTKMLMDSTSASTTTPLMDAARVPPNLTLWSALHMQRLAAEAAAAAAETEAAASRTRVHLQAAQTQTQFPSPVPLTGPIIPPCAAATGMVMPVVVPVVVGIMSAANNGTRMMAPGPEATRGIRYSMESSALTSQAIMQSMRATAATTHMASASTAGTTGCAATAAAAMMMRRMSSTSTAAGPSYEFNNGCNVNGTTFAASAANHDDDDDIETLITRPLIAGPSTPLTTTKLRQVSHGSRTTAAPPSPPFLLPRGGGSDHQDVTTAAPPAVDVVMSSSNHHPGQQGITVKQRRGHHPGRSLQEEDSIPERIESTAEAAPERAESGENNSLCGTTSTTTTSHPGVVRNATNGSGNAGTSTSSTSASGSSSNNDNDIGDLISNMVTTMAHTGTNLSRFESGEVFRIFDSMEQSILDDLVGTGRGGGRGGGETMEPHHNQDNTNIDVDPDPIVDGRIRVMARSIQELQEEDSDLSPTTTTTTARHSSSGNGNSAIRRSTALMEGEDAAAAAAAAFAPPCAMVLDHFDYGHDNYNDVVQDGVLGVDPLEDNLESILYF